MLHCSRSSFFSSRLPYSAPGFRFAAVALDGMPEREGTERGWHTAQNAVFDIGQREFQAGDLVAAHGGVLLVGAAHDGGVNEEGVIDIEEEGGDIGVVQPVETDLREGKAGLSDAERNKELRTCCSKWVR